MNLSIIVKITLDISDELVAAAENKANIWGTNITKMITEYLLTVVASTDKADEDLTPFTPSLVGCASDEDFEDYFEKKHS